jgi:tetratricopeptide (TPR) repeat protein
MMRYFISILIICTISGSLFAQQDKVEEYKLQQEQLKKTALLRELDSGVYFMDLGNYARADEKFQYVLDNVRSVPSDLTFYFGKNSFNLGKYKQSIDWLNKYIQLKGTNGQYSNEAVSLMRRAEAEFVKEKSQAMNQAGEILSANYDIDCGPAGKVTCPVCKGDHVIVKKGAFGPAYKTCAYCNEQGWLNCDEYNQLLRGELRPKN